MFRNSPLSKALSENTLGIPNKRYVEPGRELPYVIVADGVFSLKNHIMKPYALRNLTIHQRVFNYFSRTQRVVENAFGILASRFRVFHNFLRSKLPSPYTLPRSLDRENANSNLIEGHWK